MRFMVICALIIGGAFVGMTAEPKYGGTLIIGSSQTFKDLDPRICNDAYSMYVVNAR